MTVENTDADQPLPAEEQAPDPQPKPVKKAKKHVSEMSAKRNHPVRRTLRFFRTTWWMFLIAFILIGSFSNRDFLNATLLVIERVGSLALLLSFAILQFAAIFWFMARTKTEIIKPEDPKSITFEDYKGQPNLLKLVRQWISLLSDRSKFQKMGGQFVSGILLYGPPGTGKTFLAKAMAGEADVAFISIEGSGFKAMFWGVDVLKMIAFIRKARKLAREYGACIAFIDEIDAVGGSRGGVMGGNGRGPTGTGAGGMMGAGTGALTRLLYEMDGVEERTRTEKLVAWWHTKILRKPAPKRDWHVLFMGSTNRPDSLDPALVRPGRFDRKIAVEPPDRTGRRAIVQYYLSRIAHDDSIDVDAIVGDTAGYTPASLMTAITKDAVRMAIFDGRDAVNQRDIDLAFQEQAMGLENPIEEMEEDQREQVAYHEAGHAIAVYYVMPQRRIVRTTIIRRSNALGYVLSADKFELYAQPLNFYVRSIMVSLAGDVATKIRYSEPWTGTSGDFNSVQNYLWALAAQGFFGPPIGPDPRVEFKDEMTKFWKDAEAKTKKLLEEHWAEVDAIAQELLVHGDLSGKEVIKLIKEVSASNGHRPEEAEQLEELVEAVSEEVLETEAAD